MSESDPIVRQAQSLLSDGAPARAARLMGQVLAKEPNNIEALYALAVAQRHQHQWTAALATLTGILESRPGFGRAHQETGYNYIALENLPRAGAAFERAIAADPSLVNSWKCLAKLYHDSGNSERLKAVQDQLTFLESLPAELLAVISYLSDNRLADAERLCKHFLQSNRTHVEGMRLLAEIATRNGTFDEAEFLLESCVEFHPSHREARIQYANILMRMQKFARAFEQAEQLLAEYPDDENHVRALYAAACAGVGRNDAAIETYERLMRHHPDNHFFPVSLAHVHKSDGQIDEAVALYREAYRIKPDHGDAYWSLANTKSHEFTDDELARMESLVTAAATGESDRIQVCFALGDAYEQKRDYERSFGFYRQGNDLKKPSTYHDPRHLQVRIDSQIEVCTEELFARRHSVGFDAPDPIFVVGLPRAGSTLLEQILSSHSAVDGTMELHNILNLAKRLRGRDAPNAPPRYPRILGEIEDDLFLRFGEQFIEDTRVYRGTAPFFVDKMPNNFFHVGLIRLILPNAKVIDARRHPMACCFSGYKQLFGEGQEFSYGLHEIGNYYRQYVKLMDHWDEVLPDFVLCVQHESVVDDLEGQVRRILDFCGLPFEQACVDYHQTERSIRTPSAEQVRQPIYRTGLEQWRHYEAWLDPLKEALGPEVRKRYGID
ncbi:MAG: sulfotransferase [Gammaproteobacteria bacterium]|nr:sulfotransferase [Gammaproteobacteria bacterium]